MKKKKGFTLIELLVVIVILALILIIAVPSIINVLEKSKKQAFIESGISIVKSLSTSSSVDQILGENKIELPSEGESRNVSLSEIGYENGNDITGSIVVTKDSGKYRYYLYITNEEYIICNKEYTSLTKNDVEKGNSCEESLLFPTLEDKYKEQTYNYKYEITEELILNGVSASDTRDGNLTDKITYEHNIDTSVLGTYEITYKVKNSLGNKTTAKRTIYVKDTEAPTITNEILTDNIDKGSIYESYLTGVSATDNYNNSEDIEITYTCENAAYEKIECSTITNKAGTYYVVYDAKDTSGNKYSESSNEEIKRTISVNDIDAPVITLKGESIIYVEIKGTYTEEGYEAIDDEDGNVTDKVQTTSNLNLNSLGTYQVDYTVEDKSGNIGTATRTIIVQDTVNPEISVVYKTADGNIYTSDDWTNQSVTAYLTVTEEGSGLSHYLMTYEGEKWLELNQDTFTFENSIRTGMWFKAVDKADNKSNQSTTYLIAIDKTVPTISLSGVPTTVQQGNSYALPTSYTVNSNLSGGSAVCKVGNTIVTNTNTLTEGTHTINCTVTTGAGTTATVNKTITIKDAYAIGDQVTLKDGSLWYVIENSDSTSDTVTLFASKNINNTATAWTTTQSEYAMAFDEANSRPTEQNSYCTKPGSGCNMYAANGSTVIKDSTIKTFLENSVLQYINNSLISKSGVNISSIRLITTQEICNVVNASSSSNNCIPSTTQTIYLTDFANVPTWLYSTYYWTMSPYSTNSYYVFFVHTNSGVGKGSAYSTSIRGTRPVIVTSKFNIQ